LVILGLFWILPIFIGSAIGKPKNRSGGWWAFFLGWLGVIIVAVLPTKPPMTLEELEKRRPTSDPRWYEKKKAEILARGDQAYPGET
jgi:hypothetical protein